MLVNPFLTPPQQEGPQSRSWGQGLVFGFQGPPASVVEPSNAQSEDPDAFQQGVLAGQDAAINGIDVIANSCVDLNAQGPFPDGVPDVTWGTFEIADAVKVIFTKGLAGGIFGAVTGLLDISIGLETDFDNPEQQLEKCAQQLQSTLSSMGITDSMELFLGGGVDLNQRGCELQLTKVFRAEDKALDAARGIGRSQCAVVKWRTDQSGAMTLMDFYQ